MTKFLEKTSLDWIVFFKFLQTLTGAYSCGEIFGQTDRANQVTRHSRRRALISHSTPAHNPRRRRPPDIPRRIVPRLCGQDRAVRIRPAIAHRLTGRSGSTGHPRVPVIPARALAHGTVRWVAARQRLHSARSVRARVQIDAAPVHRVESRRTDASITSRRVDARPATRAEVPEKLDALIPVFTEAAVEKVSPWTDAAVSALRIDALAEDTGILFRILTLVNVDTSTVVFPRSSVDVGLVDGAI